MAATTAPSVPSTSGGGSRNTELCLDEKWKLSKKEGSFSSRNSASMNQSSSRTHHSSSRRRCAFTRKCARLVKEQRARFYIMRRCVTMLICWRDNFSDS
ncbi:hypothetical protein DCAR_0831899 [Daucus carota subsp. sativus]|uniref:ROTUNDIFOLIA like 8 n=1 Tax=Daucus carota subsp. sativus TaxID=79200 RepID=A0A175YMZ6_DAUCS|nr:hypothetical protein DCAR_0831899 [Daucus carota subsp. sativus]